MPGGKQVVDTPVPVAGIHGASPGFRNQFIGLASHQVAEIVSIRTHRIQAVSTV